jgi:oligopeptidase B
MRTTILVLCLSGVIHMNLVAQEGVPRPPMARQVPKVDTLHGDRRVDDYFWLREKSSPDVIDYLKAENAYTAAVMHPTESLQEKIYAEILRRTKQTDLSVPYPQRGYFYYTRTVEGKQYGISCRKKGSPDAPEEILLDLNVLAEGHPFLGLGAFDVSDNGQYLLYSLDTSGFRQYQPYVKNLATGEVTDLHLGPVTGAVWASDNTTLYYVTEDHAKRPYRLFRTERGSETRDLLYEETDELYRIGLGRSSDRKLLFLVSGSSETSEVRFLASGDVRGRFQLMLAREEGHEYYPDHRDGLFYIRTNKGAKNFRLVTTPVEHPDPAHWTEFLAHRPSVMLEDVDLFERFAVFTEREQGLTRLRVYNFDSRTSRDIPFAEPTYSAGGSVNREFTSTRFRYSYQSFITPPSVYDYDMVSGERTLLKQTEVLGGFDPSTLVSERIEAVAPDGVRVPISIVYRKGTKRDGTAPLLLYGYGAYGAPMSATFSVARLSLLDRGVTYAVAHIRGGGEMGEAWHDDGKMMKKRNTFTDFIACADHLVKEKYTGRDRLAIQGGSAGGLLIGAVLNMRPDLCRAAHLAVPFVDVLNTMLDASLPLTVGEYLEWGNPNVKDEYDYVRTYCPYTNIRAVPYPDMLITTSLNDSQVMYWEPAKYTAKMRATRHDDRLLLLKVNMGAGHGGASGRYDAFKETAFIFAFLLTRLGIPG